MAAYLKFDGVDGESKDGNTDSFVFTSEGAPASDKNHKEWIIIESMSAPVTRNSDIVPTEDSMINFQEVPVTYRETGGDSFAEVEWTY